MKVGDVVMTDNNEAGFVYNMDCDGNVWVIDCDGIDLGLYTVDEQRILLRFLYESGIEYQFIDNRKLEDDFGIGYFDSAFEPF